MPSLLVQDAVACMGPETSRDLRTLQMTNHTCMVMPKDFKPGSKYKFSSQLYDAHGSRRGRSQLPKGAVRKYPIRIAEVGSICRIENLQTSLQLVLFGKPELLEYGALEVGIAGSPN